MKKNICFVIGGLSYSGAEKIMTYLIKAFAEDGNNVSVMLLAKEEKYPGFEGITQIPMYDSYMEKAHSRLMRTIIRQKRIRSVIKNSDFDIIVSFGVIYNIDL